MRSRDAFKDSVDVSDLPKLYRNLEVCALVLITFDRFETVWRQQWYKAMMHYFLQYISLRRTETLVAISPCPLGWTLLFRVGLSMSAAQFLTEIDLILGKLSGPLHFSLQD